MSFFQSFISKAADIVWGPVIVALLVGTGIYLSFRTKFIQFRKMNAATKFLLSGEEYGEGDISPFQALMTSMAATIGTGNIVGVASAISFGGPGAVFWMWVSGAFGGATKFAEAFLAIKYRITNDDGEKSGGPMYYISRGLEKEYGINANWLGWLFAFFGFIASFGIGNMTQANSVSESVKATFGISPVITGIAIAVLTGLVIIGGIKNIGRVTEKLVPTMAIMYIIGSLIAIFSNITMLPAVFKMIFANAFTGQAVGGGLLGTVIRFGIARGVFSNEAGLGSAPIAHAASKNNDPMTEGIMASLGVFIDTIIICTMTALVILSSGLVTVGSNGAMVIEGNLQGATLTTAAFKTLLPGIGGYIISLGLIFFAFSTILGWFYYGSKCVEYIAGLKAVNYYSWAWIIITFIGATTSLEIVWNISDVFNGLMIIPNLIGVLGLSPIIIKATKDYDKKIKMENGEVSEQLTTP